jgi:hypothetical protein
MLNFLHHVPSTVSCVRRMTIAAAAAAADDYAHFESGEEFAK